MVDYRLGGTARVFVITVDEPFYTPIFFKKVVDSLKDSLVGVAVLSPVPRKMSYWRYIHMHYMLYGASIFVKQSLRYVKRRLIDFFFRYLKIGSPYSVQSVLLHQDVRIFKPSNVNGKEFLSILEDFDLNLIVSVASSQIFRKKLLRIPRYGCINVHGALLPKHRGVNPSFWVLLEGEKESGVTVHFMDEKIDTGSIILQRPFPVSENETLDSLSMKVAVEGAVAVSDAVSLISDGLDRDSLPPQPEGGSYHSFPTAEDGRRFRQMGLRFF
ncbi:MAG: methionyl-tRNA formyltransferase [Candidatus Odinarchaeia archaeon]